eukprot:352731-Chlamydomonas_euryale.AAC.2
MERVKSHGITCNNFQGTSCPCLMSLRHACDGVLADAQRASELERGSYRNSIPSLHAVELLPLHQGSPIDCVKQIGLGPSSKSEPSSGFREPVPLLTVIMLLLQLLHIYF